MFNGNVPKTRNGYKVVTVNKPRMPYNPRYRDTNDRDTYKKEYGKRVSDLAKFYGVEFEIASILGTNEDSYPVFCQLIQKPWVYMDKWVEEGLRSSNTKRRRYALRAFLGSVLSQNARLDARPEWCINYLAEHVVRALDAR